MSRAPHEGVDVTEAGMGPRTGDYQYPPQSVQNQASQGVSKFVDGSGPIFSMYSEMATEEDMKMAESWKADADRVFLFTGLFSAVIASLITVSIQDTRPSSQDTSTFYLANIYQALTDPNPSNISLPSSPPPFSPPMFAIWVNSLWFLSLVISLTCAVLANLLQQWARRYIKVTQLDYSPHKRARIRAFYAEGVQRFLLPWVVEVLPTMLHTSVFLFFAGLVLFLWNFDPTIFKLVLSWVGGCTALYGCITFLPIFHHDSPYYTPLSFPAWHVVTGVLFVTFRALRRLTYLVYFSDEVYYSFRHLEKSYGNFLVQGLQKTAEETALNSPSEIDTRAFMWTLDRLDEDHELERFFSGLPGFRNSKVVDDPLPSLTKEEKDRLFTALIGLLDRTFSSDLLPDPVKNRRAIIGAEALDPAEIPYAFSYILHRAVSEDQYRGLRTAEFGRVMRFWGNGGDQETALVVQAVCTSIVARAQRHDDSWLIFASNELGVSQAVLRDYAAHGDSLSLAILIHITHQQLSHFWKSSWLEEMFLKVLEAASKFNVQDTSPKLQHDFCALWNQIVLKAQNDDNLWASGIAVDILRRIRNVYITLHQDTDSPTQYSVPTTDHNEILLEPSLYPLCNIHDHHLDSTPHIRDNSAPTILSHTVPHDNAALAPTPLASPDPPSPSVPAPCRIDESLMDAPPPNNDVCVPASFHHAHQTPIENLHVPTTSPDPVTARVMHSAVVTSTTTVPLSTLNPLASTPPPTSMVSTSPPDAVAILQTADCHSPSNDPDVPSLPPPTPVLDNMLPIESHSSLLDPAAPGPSHPRLSSAPDMGAAAAGGEGTAKAALHKERDALGTPSAIRENIMAAPHLPL